ncbi:MAG: peptidoglycan DD-metalloendopeptidase family protein [Cellvibrionales bacterium]|nr:peptidoglycan DD-metalloendopeptidase family protein [Cellvibrionales bacterium]
MRSIDLLYHIRLFLASIDKKGQVGLGLALLFILFSWVLGYIELSHLHPPAEITPLAIDISANKPKTKSRKKAPQKKAKTPRDAVNFEYTVQSGDTFDRITSKFCFDKKLYGALLEADKDLLALDSLKPGFRLVFEQSNQTISRIVLILNPAKKVAYTRQTNGHFIAEPISIKGDWKSIALTNSVEHSFSRAMVKAGASAQEVNEIQQLLKYKINFAKDIQKGDRFNVLIARQFVDGEPTGRTRLKAIQLIKKHKIIEAYLYKGSYYDAKGRNVEQSFDLKPFKGDYRISSHFSLRRKHPVTGQLKPHYGTDYALPTGTPVYATGDGEVARVTRHQYAGLYVEIKHGPQFKTRYLHLSKALVKPGQKITRGMQIARSGATGRITAAHLHYEFHVNGKPVNSIKATAVSHRTLNDQEKPLFVQAMKSHRAAFTQPKTLISKR